MELPTYFDDFRIDTQPTKEQKKIMTDEHTLLRERLSQDILLKKVLLGTFIQGSQRRATAIKGSKDHPCDVDIVAVTNLPRSAYTAAYAHELFRPFLDRHYSGRFTQQERAWCITVHPEVTIDLVPTSEPDSILLRGAVNAAKGLGDWSPLSADESDPTVFRADVAKAAEWNKAEPLWIPDRTLKIWQQTHPLHLIAWTAEKNGRCNGYFSHTVKALKWWKRHTKPDPKYPKGYPLEHLLADCCPDGITSVAQGVTQSLEAIVSTFAGHASRRETPFLQARGISERQNVMKRIMGDDFARFYAHATEAARIARSALDSKQIGESADLWRQLFGSNFPKPPSPTVTGGFTARDQPTKLTEGRFG